MVLKGSIGPFDIIAIIQMVTSQQVTGVLHIKGLEKNDTFEVIIEKGMIIRVAPLFEMPVKYIAERLQRAGLLGSGQYKVLITGIKKEDINEADIPKRFSVPVSSIKRLVLSITYESLHRMYALKSGTYEFEPKAIDYDRQLFEPMNTEFVLMESSRIVDEVVHSNWRYDDDAAFQKTEGKEQERQNHVDKQPVKKAEEAEEEFIIERTTAPVEPQKEEEQIPEEKHKSAEESILEHIDGKKTFKDIYYMSLLSKNEVILTLVNLLRLGEISALSAIKEETTTIKTSLFARIFYTVKALLILFVNIVILITILYYSRINPFNPNDTKVDITYSNLLKYIGNYQQTKLSNAIEIYKLEYGNYPVSLKALVDRHILSSKDLTFPYGSEYYYTVHNGSYILIAPKYAAK
jgi:hypothetical protein